MNPDTRRWLILISGVLANVCQGAAYASSIFAVPMLTHLGCIVGGKPDMAKWALAFSINLAMLPVGMLLSGRIADQRGPRPVVMAGGLIFGAGMFLAGFANSLPVLYLTFGVMMGLGSGAAYGAVVSTAVRWFPDRRGLASGLAVAALGFGPALIAPAAQWLMGISPNPDTSVLYTFKILGIAFLVIMALASLIMVSPPSGYKPANYTPASTARAAASGVDFTWTQMLGTGRFWVLYLLYVCGAFAGLMIISQAKSIAMEINTTMDPDALKKFATSFVAIIAIANASGRFVWASVSDRIGRMQSLLLMFILTAVGMFLMPGMAKSAGTIVPVSILIGLCFGGYLGTFPPICADSFGGKNMTVNYAILFSGFGLGGLIGPYAGAAIKGGASGSYDGAYIVAGVLACIGAIVTASMVMSQARKQKAAAV